jgi:methylated-DNA-[protein]-cysteine S-methyltransferase
MASTESILAWRRLDSPMGAFLLAHRTDGSLVTDWPDRMGRTWPDDAVRRDECLPELAETLERYFAGDPVDPALSPLALPAGPDFYRRCWTACRSIPLGSTASYAELARMAGNQRAVRAAGGGMRHNPIPILVPCHRVLASNGGLGGFGGRTDRNTKAMQLKIQLLDFEASITTIHETTNRKDLLQCI